MLCPNCNKEYDPDLLAREDFDDKFHEWKFNRTPIQIIWPDATPIQREQLQTGICSDECWNKWLGVEE